MLFKYIKEVKNFIEASSKLSGALQFFLATFALDYIRIPLFPPAT